VNYLSILLLLTYLSTGVQAATGVILGHITDAENGETLPGANVVIKGTHIGATTDYDGNYRITNAPVGHQIIVISYIGYAEKELPVTVNPGSAVEGNATLQISAIMGEELVVTAQLQGQAAAINQQISSNTIVNVVSQEKIRELPDQNAAESVGRLSGVAVQRDAGEGTKVVVRGLSPKFSSITVNGERIPSTDEEDRSVDLSMISSDALELKSSSPLHPTATATQSAAQSILSLGVRRWARLAPCASRQATTTTKTISDSSREASASATDSDQIRNLAHS